MDTTQKEARRYVRKTTGSFSSTPVDKHCRLVRSDYARLYINVRFQSEKVPKCYSKPPTGCTVIEK